MILKKWMPVFGKIMHKHWSAHPDSAGMEHA
jgi:hypothetical protein